MTNHHEESTQLPALVWAVVFTILLVAAVAILALVLMRGHRVQAEKFVVPFWPRDWVKTKNP